MTMQYQVLVRFQLVSEAMPQPFRYIGELLMSKHATMEEAQAFKTDLAEAVPTLVSTLREAQQAYFGLPVEAIYETRAVIG